MKSVSHELDFTTGEAAMAFIGDTPWHELGFKLVKGSPIEDWIKAARMEWEIIRTSVKYDVADINSIETFSFPDKDVLYRSDTNTPLSVVSSSYNIVQPKEILEFYRDLVGTADMELETAGVLFGGRRFWALANTGKAVDLKGDIVKGYLLLTTSCDGTMATTAQFTSVRVVCNNTLSIAICDNNTRIRVPHNRVWRPSEVKDELGFIDRGWEEFSKQIGLLAETIAPRDKAAEFLVRVFGDPTVPIDQQSSAVTQRCANVWELYIGTGIGSKLESSEHTFWGLVNSVTESIDYHTNHRTTDARLNGAWYGAGNQLKTKAFEIALEMATR